jgi:16S rRNA C1402 N4-methylase RsmH
VRVHKTLVSGGLILSDIGVTLRLEYDKEERGFYFTQTSFIPFTRKAAKNKFFTSK